MSGLARVVRSGVRRRRVPSLVIGLAVLMAVTASVLGGSLLVASSAPFDRAFARQHGAHLVGQFDAAKATEPQVAATAHAKGVTAEAGPFPTVSVTPTTPRTAGPGLTPMTLAGRADPAGPVDAVSLTAGRWVRSPDELVLSAAGPELAVGTDLEFPDLPGDPTLTVVGIARSVSQSADGWVEPEAITTPSGYQMLYQFASAATDAQVTAHRAALTASVPADALAGAQSWLAVKRAADQNTGVFVPFLAAFGVLGLAMSVLIVGNVVAGTVGASTRRIGILKALGCTPAQVIRAYVAQALVPAGVGTVLGVLAGNALTMPVLAQTDSLYGTPASGVAPWVDIAVVAGMLGVVAGTGWLAAWRAGRLRTVDALRVGPVSTGGRGRLAGRVAAALPAPPSVGLGLAHPLARPARALGLLAAVAFGTVTVTFALGLAASLNDIQAAKNHDNADVLVNTLTSPYGPHRVDRVDGPRPAATATPAQIAAAIAAQPGTRAYYATAQTAVTAAGVSGAIDLYAFTGDATWAGYQMVAGTWFHGSGEAVAVSTFLSATSTRIGDTVTLFEQGRPVRVKIVGEVFDPHTDPEVLVDAATVPDLAPDTYHIELRSDTDVGGYITQLDGTLRQYGVMVASNQAVHSGTLLALATLTGLLTLALVLVAGLGVLNTVVLDTRDRVHDIGVYKALGMTPRQTTGMVLASVPLPGLLGGLLGVPAGYGLHAAVTPAMGHAAGLNLPAQALDTYGPAELAALVVAGLVIAALGALIPAGWAARTRTATALRTE
ncbi:FtsX-like permease family protein [Asanoa sp. NPDC049573]|uniref:ABC transporter permease n=1 Tax=Asanoa sp. NPDC049573 TaxID=3155396 RepID=UPI00341F1DBD